MAELLWFTHPECGLHEMGAGHPESPERLDAVERAVAASPVGAHRRVTGAPAATQASLARAHDGRYVEAVMKASPRSGYHRLDADTTMNSHTAEAALRAAGACVEAVGTVMQNGGGQAFCAVRPPGHHAERAQPMGFCLFDNVAVAANEALARGAKRVAILDFDVHYGNGTVDIFRDNPDVLVANTYQFPLYPFWPDGGGGANLADAPLPPGAGGAEFRDAVETVWYPAVERFAPEVILVSAGFDAHRDDPLANLNVGEDDYRWIGGKIRDWAERHSGGRVVATLEGGYNLRALGSSVVAFLEGLTGVGSRPGALLQSQ